MITQIKALVDLLMLISYTCAQYGNKINENKLNAIYHNFNILC